MNAGWLNEVHSYALPLDARGQITEVVVHVDEKSYAFPIRMDR